MEKFLIKGSSLRGIKGFISCSGAKNAVIKSNLKQVIRSIHQDFITCEINGGNIDRYVRTGGGF